MVSAQEPENIADNLIYDAKGLDLKPNFPRGMGEFYNGFVKHYRTPDVKKLNGKIYLTFVIEKDGSLTDIKVLKDIGYGTGKEAIRVLKLCPKWIPGEQNGQKVRCLFTLPITIRPSE